MIIKLCLHNPKLQFIPFGKGKVHARWNGLIPSTGVDLSKHTMCGRDITAQMQPMDEREMDVKRICGNCYSSLRTYGPQVEMVRVESEVGK